jgi:hypothetical protein
MVQRSLVALLACFALAPACADATTWTKQVIASDTEPDPLLATAADGSGVLAWNHGERSGAGARWLAVDAYGRPGSVHSLEAPAEAAELVDLDVSPAGAAIVCTEGDGESSDSGVLLAATRRPGGPFGRAYPVATVQGEAGISACAIDDAGDAIVGWTDAEAQPPAFGGATHVVRLAPDGSLAPVQTLRAAYSDLEDVVMGAGGQAYATLRSGRGRSSPFVAAAPPAGPFDTGTRLGALQRDVGVGTPAVDPAGAALIAWVHGTAIHVDQARPGQVTELSYLRDPLGRPQHSAPNVAAGAGGQALVTWLVPASPTDQRKSLIRAALLRPGSGLGAPRTLAALDSFFIETAAVASDGTGAVVWLQSDHTGLARAQVTIRRPGGSWGPVTSLSRGAREDFDPPFPAVAGAPGGHALAAWAEPSRRGEDFGERRLVLARVAAP